MTVTVHYQALPPYYLRDRFATAQGSETQRLFWMASRLNVADQPIDGWTLPVASDAKQRLGRGRNRWDRWTTPVE